jgi:hypothetical protein
MVSPSAGDVIVMPIWLAVFTVTVAAAVVVPPLPVAVMVYVAVFAGETNCVPLVETAPMPWSMEHETASVALQVSVLDWPGLIVAGFAEIVTVGGGIKVTVAAAVVVPEGPVAVMVYVAVFVGETVCVPLVATVPMPWSMEHAVALVALQVNVLD